MNLLLGTIRISLLASLFMEGNYLGKEQPDIENPLLRQFLQDWSEVIIPEQMIRSSNENEPEQRSQDSQDTSDNSSNNDDEDYDRPTNRTAGADRDSCPNTALPLTALIPTWGPVKTVSRLPNLWFYIPYNSSPNLVGEFTYKDSNDNRVYRGHFELPETPGLVNIQVPETSEHELAIGENYHWFLKVYCDPRDSFSYVHVDAHIRRVAEPSILEQQTSSPEDLLYDFYAESEIWHDAVTSLATQLSQDPENRELQNDWQSLAEILALGEIMQKPLVNCCELRE